MDNDSQKTVREQLIDNDGILVTWLNHYSLLRADLNLLKSFDLILVDGTFLQLWLRLRGHKITRTSADIILPELLPSFNQIILIGGTREELAIASRKFCNVILEIDGYNDLVKCRSESFWREISVGTAVIVSLGPNFQEAVALEIYRSNPHLRVITAGGWIGQIGRVKNYYPSWIHIVRLAWLVRIFKEPKRLWKRYSIDALKFLLTGNSYLQIIDSFKTHKRDYNGWSRKKKN